jgi:hypothetical protein
MPELRLPKLPDRTPVKITISVSPDLNQALLDYAALYGEVYGPDGAGAGSHPGDARKLPRRRPRVRAPPARSAGLIAMAMFPRPEAILPEPISVRIPEAVRLTGLSRSRIL